MKKIMVSSFALILTVLFCSCGNPAQKRDCFSVPENYVCGFSAQINGVTYSGELECENGVYAMTLEEPESVRDLSVEYEGGKYIVKFGESGLSLTPQEDFVMKDIIDFLEKSRSEESIVCEKTDDAYIISHNGWSLSFPVGN